VLTFPITPPPIDDEPTVTPSTNDEPEITPPPEITLSPIIDDPVIDDDNTNDEDNSDSNDDGIADTTFIPNNTNNNTPKSEVSNTDIKITKDLTENEILLSFLDDSIPLFTFGNSNVYLFAPFDVPSWTVINLVLTVISIVLVILITFIIIRIKKRYDKEIIKDVLEVQRDFVSDDNSLNTIEIVNTLEKVERTQFDRKSKGFIVAGILAIISITILLITQNFIGIIALFDWWTIAHIIILAGVIIGVKIVLDKKEEIKHSELYVN